MRWPLWSCGPGHRASFRELVNLLKDIERSIEISIIKPFLFDFISIVNRPKPRWHDPNCQVFRWYSFIFNRQTLYHLGHWGCAALCHKKSHNSPAKAFRNQLYIQHRVAMKLARQSQSLTCWARWRGSFIFATLGTEVIKIWRALPSYHVPQVWLSCIVYRCLQCLNAPPWKTSANPLGHFYHPLRRVRYSEHGFGVAGNPFVMSCLIEIVLAGNSTATKKQLLAIKCPKWFKIFKLKLSTKVMSAFTMFDEYFLKDAQGFGEAKSTCNTCPSYVLFIAHVHRTPRKSIYICTMDIYVLFVRYCHEKPRTYFLEKHSKEKQYLRK